MDNSHYSICRIRQHLLNLTITEYDGLHFIKLLEDYDGEPSIALYAWKYTKAKGRQIKCVGYEFIDKNFISDDLSFSYMAGYNVLFDGDSKKYYGYVKKATNEFHETTDLWYPNVTCERLFNAKELKEMFKDKVPYLEVPNLTSVVNPMQLLRDYKNDHNCEMLTKVGFPYLHKYSKAFNKLTPAKRKEFVRWIANNKEYMYCYQPIYQFIIKAMKNKENGYQCRKRCMAISNGKYLKANGINRTTEQMYEINSYLEKQGSDIRIYKDYLQMSEKLHRDINDRGVQYPRNLIESHDNVSDILNKNVNRKINKALKPIVEVLEKFSCKYKDLHIVVPKTQTDLVNWGSKLHNCVGSHGFGKEMSEGKCIILGVFHGKDIVECCELGYNKNFKTYVRQLRGDHNQDSAFHENATKLINKFKRNYVKPAELVGVAE